MFAQIKNFISEYINISTFKFAFKTLFIGIIITWIAVSLTFFLARLAPGDPFSGSELPPEVKQTLKAQRCLDKSMVEQYRCFVRDIFTGELRSYKMKDKKVFEIIGDPFARSALLGSISMIFAIIVGILLGMISAVNHNTLLDNLVMASATIGKSVPPMVLAPAVIAIFCFGFKALNLPYLPAAGWDFDSGILNGIKYLILPVFCLAVYDITNIARLTRNALLEVLRTKHLTTARAKGLSEKRVLFVHALREAMIPLITVIAPMFASILVGTIVVETVFQIPGLGRFYVSAIVNRDYDIVLVVTGLSCVLNVIALTFVDISLGFLDPRISIK